METKNGVMYKGRFYEFGTIEYRNLMLIEGKKDENKDTLLGYFSDIETDDNCDNLIDKN